MRLTKQTEIVGRQHDALRQEYAAYLVRLMLIILMFLESKQHHQRRNIQCKLSLGVLFTQGSRRPYSRELLSIKKQVPELRKAGTFCDRLQVEV